MHVKFNVPHMFTILARGSGTGIHRLFVDKTSRIHEKFNLRFLPILTYRTVLIRLLKFIVLISLCTHFVACLWYIFGCQAGKCHSSTWALTAELLDTSASDADHYCTSLYWAVTTMTTTGYGDLSATNVQVNGLL